MNWLTQWEKEYTERQDAAIKRLKEELAEEKRQQELESTNNFNKMTEEIQRIHKRAAEHQWEKS